MNVVDNVPSLVASIPDSPMKGPQAISSGFGSVVPMKTGE